MWLWQRWLHRLVQWKTILLAGSLENREGDQLRALARYRHAQLAIMVSNYCAIREEHTGTILAWCEDGTANRKIDDGEWRCA